MSDSSEEFIPEEEEGEGPALVQKLRERLKKAVAEKQEYLEGWQRARADFANYKKEESSLRSDKETALLAKLVTELLPALDTFELSLKHNPGKDLQVVHKQLLDGLRKLGVGQFGAPGEAFDPYRFEALQEVSTVDEQKDHTVESVARAGYAIGDRIIRPAHVSVYIHQKS